MSNTEDKTPIDNELKAYLAGEDGVSAAYRQAGAEEPPEELDRLILAAARSAVESEKPRTGTSPRQKFSLAASFMVGVLVTSMYFNQQGDFMADVAVPSAPEAQSVEQPAPAFAPAAPAPAITSENIPPEPLTEDVSQQALRLGQEVARAIGPAETQEPPQAKAEANVGAAAEDNANVEREVASAIDAGRRNAGQTAPVAGGAAAPAAPAIIADAAPPTVATAAAEADTTASLAEIMVTGSRIRSDDEVDPGYRQTREEWLAQILALREQAFGQAQLLEEINGRLVEEVRLFSEAYPDFDLNAELETLE